MESSGGGSHSRGTAYSGRECAGGTVDAAEQNDTATGIARSTAATRKKKKLSNGQRFCVWWAVEVAVASGRGKKSVGLQSRS